jgi:hypothetical protein
MTAKGRQASVRLAGPGRSKFNPATGELQLIDLPFEVTVDGKKDRLSVNMTTEQVSTIIGSFSGKRAQISGRTARLAMVGTSAPKKTSIMSTEDASGQRDKPFGNQAVARKKAGGMEQIAEQRGTRKIGNGPLLPNPGELEAVAVFRGEGQVTGK